LWQFRSASILTELLLVILGALCYWRAAAVVTSEAGTGRTRARVTAALIFVCGVIVLAMDVTG
jgi:hypothetical protein